MKKLTALLLMLAMAITLTACGGNATQGDTPEQTPSGETPTATENQTPTPTPDSSGPNSANETPDATPQQDIGIGGIIKFGGYDWLVLDEQDGRKLIISQNVTEYREYHSEYGDLAMQSVK